MSRRKSQPRAVLEINAHPGRQTIFRSGQFTARVVIRQWRKRSRLMNRQAALSASAMRTAYRAKTHRRTR